VSLAGALLAVVPGAPAASVCNPIVCENQLAADSDTFTNAGIDNPPVQALPSSASGGNGVYLYSSGPALRTCSYNDANY
jgi:hypothetical protein